MDTVSAETPKSEFYTKGFLSVPEQLEKLVSEKGLVVHDEPRALGTLRSVGYYRLSGYWHFFRDSSNSGNLKSGTTMDIVHKLYLFDQKLKMKVSEASQVIEVALRFQIGHVLGRASTFAHLDVDQLSFDWTKSRETKHPFLGRTKWSDSEHARFQAKVLNMERISGERFVEHFKIKYELPHLPTWVVTEILSYGNLLALYNGSRQEAQQRIAAAMGFVDVDGVPRVGEFRTALDHLRYVRNICAHYSRLWNQSLTVKLPQMSWSSEMSHLNSWQEGGKPRVYDTLVLLAYLVGQVEPKSTWWQEVIDLVVDELDELEIPLSHMGFPPNWETLPIWSASYVPSNSELHGALDLLDNFGAVYTAEEAGSRFLLNGGNATVAAEGSSKEKKARAVWARKKGALLGIRVGTRLNIPDFQIDESGQCLVQAVADLNYRLFMNNNMSPMDDAAHFRVATWWVTPNAGIANQKPLIMQKNGTLDLGSLDLTVGE